MPCRREEEEKAGEEAEGEEKEQEDSFLLLEQPARLGGSAEVDRLVAQIGEALQLDPAQDSPASLCAPPWQPLQPPLPLAEVPAYRARPPALPLHLPPSSVEATNLGALYSTFGDCGSVRDWAAPYLVAEFAAGPTALSLLPPQPGFEGTPGSGKPGASRQLSGRCRRGWLRGAAASRRLRQRLGPRAKGRTSDDDSHRLLQQLLLSGNLIKEAVRRLRSRRLHLYAKLPQRRLPGPVLPRSSRAACSDPGASRRSAPLRTADRVLVPSS
ncbi:proto-oncogene FRAT1 [Elephas maximus indicus]|uniref:proto-oncogene FRAT1 n=1 Tax=Elephas maximus indicus TaxID=99487 RepID=UPI00211656D9|nr:proto-oncogene FRAT1 [Elephas maximus indicus]